MTIDCKRPNKLTCNRACVLLSIDGVIDHHVKKKLVKEVVRSADFFRYLYLTTFNRSMKGKCLKCSCSIKLDNKNDTKYSKTR